MLPTQVHRGVAIQIHVFHRANPFPDARDLARAACLTLCGAHVGISLHNGRDSFPDPFALAEAELLAQDIVAQLRHRDPGLRKSRWIRGMERGSSGEAAKGKGDELRDSLFGGRAHTEMRAEPETRENERYQTAKEEAMASQVESDGETDGASEGEFAEGGGTEEASLGWSG